MEDDGCTYRTKGEHYCAYGHVTVKIGVSFETCHDPDDPGFEADLCKTLDEMICDEYELVNDDELTIEIEDDEE